METTGYKNVFWCAPVIFFKPNGSHLPEEDPTLPQTSGRKIEVFVKKIQKRIPSQEDLNVICVDWAPGAAWPLGRYLKASANTALVGKQISLMIETINEVFKEEINQRTHIIGYSLGGHVAGMAGYHLGGNLARITGTVLFRTNETLAVFHYKLPISDLNVM